jgi:N-methylhydantoinase A
MTSSANSSTDRGSSVRYRVGVDIGGTFTDIVLAASDGSVATEKVLSTVDDYGEAIGNGLTRLFTQAAARPHLVDEIVHGTTVATNAILENKGASTALITTRGFRDVLELRRIRIPALYDLDYQKPAPLVRRRLRFEVSERIDATGNIVEPLDRSSVDEAIRKIEAAGVESVAICLLHSYRNDIHEREVAQMLAQAIPGLYVTCSADILPEIREYERTSTAVINSYVGPVVSGYLRRLQARLEGIGIRAPLLVMQSNGGTMTADVASQRPAQIVESGPAAGVIAAHAVALQAGYPNVITLDMGGTTAKASLIEEGQVALTAEYEVGAGINTSSLLVSGGGYALKLPAIDISEVGAGGGSMVRLTEGGRLQVGPESAGARPGPVCYQLGGTNPTVTDANLVLGYLNPSRLAGGTIEISQEAARAAIEGSLARPLGMSVLEAAYGVHVLASAQMVRSVKAVSTHRGRDPRDFVLLGFGGSGPLHVCEMARQLEINRIIVPPTAGVLSAFGLLFADIEHQSVRTVMKSADAEVSEALRLDFEEMEKSARLLLEREGYEDGDIFFTRQADLRYVGQGFEITIPVPSTDGLGVNEIAEIKRAFGDEHHRMYGHRSDHAAAEIVSIRSNAKISRSDASNRRADGLPLRADTNGRHAASTLSSRDIYFGEKYGSLATRCLTRSELPRVPVQGPLIIEEYDTTCVIHPEFDARTDEFNNIVIENRSSQT